MTIENQHYQPKGPVIRALLKEFQDGLSTKDICQKTGIDQKSARANLKKMADCYIDRWTAGGFREPPTAIWCVVDVPENCPRPMHKKKGSISPP